MMRRFSAAVIILGVMCVVYSVWSILESRHEQVSALSQAKKIVRKSSEEPSLKSKLESKSETKSGTKPALKKTKEKQKAAADSSLQPKAEEIIGMLKVPRLNKELPIVEGTDLDMLKLGVGHYKTSALPGQKNQIVLSGHRDTVFRHFGDLKKGDDLTVTLKNGRFNYKIDHTKIVKADDRSIIHSTYPKEELVLTTCYPFSYIGNAPDRYIIYAYPTNK